MGIYNYKCQNYTMKHMIHASCLYIAETVKQIFGIRKYQKVFECTYNESYTFLHYIFLSNLKVYFAWWQSNQ